MAKRRVTVMRKNVWKMKISSFLFLPIFKLSPRDCLHSINTFQSLLGNISYWKIRTEIAIYGVTLASACVFLLTFLHKSSTCAFSLNLLSIFVPSNFSYVLLLIVSLLIFNLLLLVALIKKGGCSLMASNLHSETKESQLKSDCYLHVEGSSLQ